jgi:hypothetical protein
MVNPNGVSSKLVSLYIHRFFAIITGIKKYDGCAPEYW